jgi:hypothetical protein
MLYTIISYRHGRPSILGVYTDEAYARWLCHFLSRAYVQPLAP